ncbi:MAG: phosphodiesterase YaeI [Lentisphaerae bacterium]|nr:MAG: phosphodiesterase YaeI [Lentisphaerota bacterium]
MGLSRRQFLKIGVSCLVAGGGLGYLAWDTNDLEVTEKRLAGKGLESPVRVLHLSDLHVDATPESLQRCRWAFELGLSMDVDLAFMTGDFITRDLVHVQEYGELLKLLSSQVPCFACLGNHDGGAWAAEHHGLESAAAVIDLLERNGIEVLVNRRREVRAGGGKIDLVGLADLWSGEFDPGDVFNHDESEKGGMTWVLSHNPESWKRIREYDWDMMWSGHTHGGQVIVPLVGWRPFLPVHDGTLAEGLIATGKSRYVHITRGVGSILNVRLFCRPEVSVVEIG